MSRIPMQHRGKRPRMFAAPGMDEMVSISLELMAELWVLKKRLYLLERTATNAGLELSAGIEHYNLSDAEVAELDAIRHRMIANVLRSLEANNVAHTQVRTEAREIGARDAAAVA